MEPADEAETRDSQAYDLVLYLDELADDYQSEARADCGCQLECTEWTVGFIFCDLHRQAPLLLRRAGYDEEDLPTPPPALIP